MSLARHDSVGSLDEKHQAPANDGVAEEFQTGETWTLAAKGFMAAAAASSTAMVVIISITQKETWRQMKLQLSSKMGHATSGIMSTAQFPSFIHQFQTIFAAIALVTFAFLAVRSHQKVYVFGTLAFNAYLVLAAFLDGAQRKDLGQLSSTKNVGFYVALFWALPGAQLGLFLLAAGAAFVMVSDKARSLSAVDSRFHHAVQTQTLLRMINVAVSTFVVLQAWSLYTIGGTYLDDIKSLNDTSRIVEYVFLGLLMSGAFISHLVLRFAVPRESKALTYGAIGIQVALVAFQIAAVVTASNRFVRYMDMMYSSHAAGGSRPSYIGAIKAMASENKIWAQVAITTFLHLFHLVWTYFTLSTYGVGLKAARSVSRV